jgi:hypothetical protein
MGRGVRNVLASFLLLAVLGSGAAADPASPQLLAEVDLALVIAVDVSSSVSTERWELQKEGYVAAFRSREVIDAIMASGPTSSIAVTFVEWSGQTEQRQVIGWTILGDPDSAGTFASAVSNAPRVFSGLTSVSGAIDFSMQLLQDTPFRATRKVIDVSGDGSSNDGRSAITARDDAANKNITVNGLPILADEKNLDGYYRDQVIGGPGAFVVVAQDYKSFASAIIKKLILEIVWLPGDDLLGG